MTLEQVLLKVNFYKPMNVKVAGSDEGFRYRTQTYGSSRLKRRFVEYMNCEVVSVSEDQEATNVIICKKSLDKT